MNLKKSIQFFKNLEKKIPKGYYLHISNKKIDYKNPNFFNLKIKQIYHMKPIGLWLSGGISEKYSWINWVLVQEEMDWYEPPSKFFYYAVKVDMKSPKLLMLDTQDKIIQFHKDYKVGHEKYEMKWSKLEQEGYYGVYIKLFKDLIDRINTFTDEDETVRKLIWYVSLDCTCLCIWNNKLILDITELKN